MKLCVRVRGSEVSNGGLVLGVVGAVFHRERVESSLQLSFL